ncbi:MAG: hypothetical protein WAN75_36370, partial [Xanthobacteraceae bacterium]
LQWLVVLAANRFNPAEGRRRILVEGEPCDALSAVTTCADMDFRASLALGGNQMRGFHQPEGTEL